MASVPPRFTKNPSAFGEKLTPGDVIVKKREDGLWNIIKILAVDRYPDIASGIHCLTYQFQSTKPVPEAIANLPVMIWHAPISANGFEDGFEVLCHDNVTSDEMKGFEEYLKHTDLARYCEFTGHDLEDLLDAAQQHYLNANELCDQNRKLEGIEEYGKAIELAPSFFEAIDNRSFTYMELGDFKTALAGFDQSLIQNPQGPAAFFSRGDCLMRMGKVEEAIIVFRESAVRFPSTKQMCERSLKVIEDTRRELDKNGH